MRSREQSRIDIGKYIDEKYPPNHWIWGRNWDDDCICPNDDIVDPKCINKRCVELRDK